MKRSTLPLLCFVLSALGCSSPPLSERAPWEGWKPSAPAASREQVCEVAAGDTLWGISRRYQVTVESLKARNLITEERALSVGTLLIIPDAAAVPAPVPSPVASVAPAPVPGPSAAKVPAKGAAKRPAPSRRATTRTAGQAKAGSRR